MSGTSADGVDAALVRVEGRGTSMTAKLLAHEHAPYDPQIREAIFRARKSAAEPVRLDELARLAREISLAYAGAVRRVLATSGTNANDVAAVAAHGQTLFHLPPDTLQWLDPAALAAEVGCVVVSDFRRADCAAGGQGAPLVPFADYVLFRHPQKNRVLLNLGGIANITWLPAGAGTSARDVIAFDTGPANCIVDNIMHPEIDTGGKLSARGRVNKRLLRDVLKSPYFDRVPPKSTDGPEMIAAFHDARRGHPNATRLTDLLATACAVTATSVAQSIVRWCPARADEVIASGGGTKNAAIMTMLRQEMGDVPVLTIDELGMPSEAKEAVAFALLGAATLDGEPSNVPAATGASRAVVLGSITPKP
jgi:anhydro-N-acetylmuramic acid kinase